MSDYVKWKRRPDVGPGHRLIWVLMDTEKAEPVKLFKGRTDVQCATMEHDPFCLPLARLVQHYEPA